MSFKKISLCAVALVLCTGACFAKPTDAERDAAIEVFKTRMANYTTNEEGDVTSFDLTDRICTNEDLAKICKLDTVTTCKIYGANLKPGGASVITGLKSCTKLSIENTDFQDDDMAFLVDMPWVTELTLRRNTYLRTKTIEYVSQMPNLRNLVLLYGNFDDSALAYLSKVKTLRLLDLRGCASVTDAGLACVKELPNLIVLKLRCTAVTNAGIENVRGKKLKTFGIEDSQTFDDEALGWLGEMVDSMQEVTIMRCIAISDDGVQKLAGLKNMRKLNLRGNYSGSDALKICANMPELTQLIVSENVIDDEGLTYLEGLTKLEHLDLWANIVTDSGVDSLVKIQSLKKLSLVACQITDEGVAKLAALSNLADLDLAETSISDACIDSLAQMKSLKAVSFRATSVSEEAMAKLREALPECKVTK
ncbi:MAG: hypothetical protein Q4A17_10795 [Thermoguttaceae bacterium]|nr:hypothetical protein [Thermoguttaceae bacterium]MDO4858419.1 hypothetical protein [Thermoguttaceae bacterium]